MPDVAAEFRTEALRDAAIVDAAGRIAAADQAQAQLIADAELLRDKLEQLEQQHEELTQRADLLRHRIAGARQLIDLLLPGADLRRAWEESS